MVDLEYIKDIVKKNIIGIVLFLVGFIMIIASILIVYYNKENLTCPICPEDEEVEVTSDNCIQDETLKVDVKGAVKNPGVYELQSGSNILDAITIAGGVTSKGVTTNINLSKKLTDEMVIYIFTSQELKEKTSQNEIVCEVPTCECETIEVVECPSVNESDNSSSTSSDGKISINTASKEELMTLDGIGSSKAQDIIDYREKNGLFTALEDIMNVSGIGEAVYEKIKDKIKL